MTQKSVQVCPACGEGHLRLQKYVTAVEHKGNHREIPQLKLRCDHCRADLFDEECGKANRRAWVTFQKEIEGVPTGAQIRAMRKAVGLTSEEAGLKLGGGKKAFSKYENEEIIPQGAMRTLINYLIANPNRITEVLESNGVPRARRREVAAVPQSAQAATGNRAFISSAAAGDYTAAMYAVQAAAIEAIGQTYDPFTEHNEIYQVVIEGRSGAKLKPRIYSTAISEAALVQKNVVGYWANNERRRTQ